MTEKTVLHTLRSGAPWLEKAGVEDARMNMEYLLAHVLGLKRLDLYLQFNRVLTDEELKPLRELVRRRSKREPLQHLLGTVEFCGREFKCDARALIPRPETEELVEKILADCRAAAFIPAHILDMGTGSGVIGLSLLHAFPAARAVLADVSPEALMLARENAELTGAPADRLTFVQSDLFTALEGRKFDLIAANLPYISAEEILTLSAEVRRDPVLALDGGTAGTELIIKFVRELPGYAEPNALIALEAGAGQSAELLEIMSAAGLREVRAANDLQGRDRFLFARIAGA